MTVAEEGSVTKAAARMFVAQPSLSRQLRDLERHVGQDLFVRTSQGVQLTEAGRQLLPRAQAIVADVESAVRMVRDSASPVDGTAVVVTSTETVDLTGLAVGRAG